MEFDLYLTCPRGLEKHCLDELSSIGITDVQIDKGGLFLKGDLSIIYKINYQSRLGMQLLVKIGQFNVVNEESLYKSIYSIEWTKYLTYIQTFSVKVRTRRSWIKNTQFAALKVKDAIVDRLRDYSGRRASIDTKTPDLPIDIFMDQNNCIVYLNSSGDPLFKRGYRNKIHKAAINETLAAGLIALSGWDSKIPLFDPMCGSGTLLIEAALKAYNIPPRINRQRYAFMRWLNYDKYLWNQITDDCQNKINLDKSVIINGSDLLDENIELALETTKNLNIQNMIKFKTCNIRLFRPLTKKYGYIITNPPYGERIGGNEEDLENLFQLMYEIFIKHCLGFKLFIISPDSIFMNQISITKSSSLPIKNGKLDCLFNEYNINKNNIINKNA